MLLHHACSFLLILSMIAANNLPIGCVILFLHDIADIPTALVKLTTQFKGKFSLPIDMFFYTAMVTSWFWTRNIVLSNFTYLLLTEVEYSDPVWKPYNFILKMSGVLLAFLCALHIYWMVLMLNMLLSFAGTGKAEDLQNSPQKTNATSSVEEKSSSETDATSSIKVTKVE